MIRRLLSCLIALTFVCSAAGALRAASSPRMLETGPSVVIPAQVAVNQALHSSPVMLIENTGQWTDAALAAVRSGLVQVETPVAPPLPEDIVPTLPMPESLSTQSAAPDATMAAPSDSPLTGAKRIAAGGFHTCVVTSANTVQCWGDNRYGQVGCCSLTTMPLPKNVTRMNGMVLDGIRDVVAGAFHTCALASDGEVYCWGANGWGQLGDSSRTTRNYPISMGLGRPAIEISAGGYHTCALLQDGDIKCWGRNDTGQVGNGTTTDALLPVDVHLGEDAAHISTGGYHTCAVGGSGAVYCWGHNGWGQIGDGTLTNRLRPTRVSGLGTSAVAVAAGWSYGCALNYRGGVSCWGNNEYGQIGDGTTTNRSWPVEVINYGKIAVDAGEGAHVCALKDDGGVRCWGANDHGQLGDGTRIERHYPTDVFGVNRGIWEIAVGAYHSCARTDAGYVRCWGANHFSQLGDGTTAERTLASTVLAGDPLPYDAAALASQSPYLTVAPGATVDLWIEVRNTGNTIWRASDDYGWRGDDMLVNQFGTISGEVPPNAIWRWAQRITAPTTPGEYVYGFMLRHGTQEFGPYFFIRVTVQLPSISGYVRDGSGRPIQGVLIDAGGGRTATTNTSGGYTLSNLPVGRYTLTPKKADYLFVPPSHTVDAPPSWPNLDFTAVPYSDISVNRIEAAQVFLDHKVGTSDEIPLIAGKQTMVRVYVKVNGNTPVAGMMARLRIRDANGQDHSVSTVINGSVTGKGNPDPLKLNDTINFLPNTQWLTGTVTFWADVFNRGQAVATSGPHQVDFRRSRPMVVGIVPVKYRGQSVTAEQIKGLTSWAEEVYPTHMIKIKTSYPSFLYTDDLAIDCDHFADILEDSYGSGVDFLYALFPDGALEATGILGEACRRSWPEYPSPSGKVAYGEADILLNQRKQVFTHELAHLLGRSHIGVNEAFKCIGRVNEYSDWPYSNHRIQVPGLDAAAFGVKSASGTADYMSYCWGWRGWLYASLGYLGKPAWTSPHTYRQLFDAWFSQLPPWASESDADGQKASFVVSGIVKVDGTATLQPIWQRNTATPDINPPAGYVNPPAGTGYCAVATSSSGSVLTTYCFDLDFFDQHEGVSKPQDSFYLVLPNPGNLARIALTKNGIELAARQVSAHLPTIAVTVPNGGEIWPATGIRTIRWTATDLDSDPLTHNVYYSRNGSDWAPVAMGIQDTEVNVDLAELGGGSTAKVRVEVTDGFNTASDESDSTFSVASKAPWAVILSPEPGRVIPTGHAILLQGDALSLEEGTLGNAAYCWSSNRDGDLGTGANLVAVLSPGAHTLTLMATAGSGLSATETVEVFVGAKAYLPIMRK